MIKIHRDRTRTTNLWLKNDTYLEIPEDMWPEDYQADTDDAAAEHWSDVTGLNVTIKTETLTTVDTR